MSKRFSKAIHEEATKLVARHQTYASRLAEESQRIEKRTGTKPSRTVQSPSYWKIDGFNPYKVRSRADTIARAIDKAVSSRTYEPRPSIRYEVPKADGSSRPVSVFQVADNALSRLVYKNILAKNATRFSARCYAYREDVSVHDAVLYISSEFRDHPRLFIAEFDFSKYFDSISHEHLRRLLKDPRFLVTKRERDIIEAFMGVTVSTIGDYPEGAKTDQGIPQGTSISLFLANLAASSLDRRLERLGVGFARYADDTLIWSNDYSRVCEAVEILNAAATDMGVELNIPKSEGISILAPSAEVAEFRTKSHVDFLGYRIGPNEIGIRSSSIERQQDRLSKIVYWNLLESAACGGTRPQRTAPRVDRDYVTMIFQLRRSLYGGLSEKKLARYLSGRTPKIHYRGFMSFFPLVDDDDALRELDGWLLHTVFTTLRKRTQILQQQGYGPLPTPHGLDRDELVDFSGRSSGGDILDLRLPSFIRISRMLRKATRQYGPNSIAHPKSGQYYVA